MILCATTKRKRPHCGAIPSLPSDCLVDQTQGHGFVASGNDAPAGFAHAILGHANTVASHASVGVHGKTAVTDPAHFSAEVAHAQFAGFALSKALAGLEVGENAVGLGFGIDVFHRITFL